jgi:hypothetical protein
MHVGSDFFEDKTTACQLDPRQFSGIGVHDSEAPEQFVLADVVFKLFNNQRFVFGAECA